MNSPTPPLMVIPQKKMVRLDVWIEPRQKARLQRMAAMHNSPLAMLVRAAIDQRLMQEECAEAQG
jgi:hypothetical protein